MPNAGGCVYTTVRHLLCLVALLRIPLHISHILRSVSAHLTFISLVVLSDESLQKDVYWRLSLEYNLWWLMYAHLIPSAVSSPFANSLKVLLFFRAEP